MYSATQSDCSKKSAIVGRRPWVRLAAQFVLATQVAPTRAPRKEPRMPKQLGILRFPFAVSLLILSTGASATLPSAPVTTCGQVIPKRTTGYLTADLDCTAFVGDEYAVEVGEGSTLDLGGFTLSGGYVSVACLSPCPGGQGECWSRCAIKNGTVQGAEQSGITGDKITLDAVTVRDHGDRGINGGRRVRVSGSTITGNGLAGVLATRIIVDGSTITGNGRTGIATTPRGRVRVENSTIIDNDTSPDCSSTSLACFDIGSGRRPQVRHSTCKRSFVSGGAVFSGCSGWCVCSEDGP